MESTSNEVVKIALNGIILLTILSRKENFYAHAALANQEIIFQYMQEMLRYLRGRYDVRSTSLELEP